MMTEEIKMDSNNFSITPKGVDYDILIAELNEKACADEAREKFYNNLLELEKQEKENRKALCKV